jgi:AcrR family transcriptional regulator
MSTLTRKQREIREREQMLLRVARKMLIEQGFANLSMDRLAEATEYSKGTIYQHFSTKEDLVTALAVESCEQRLILFDKARKFDGRPRERMLALGVADELFARLHPHYFQSEQVIRLADLENRASTGRLETLLGQDACCAAWAGEIIGAAVEAGELTLAPGRSVGDVTFAVLSVAIGTHSVMLTLPHLVQELGIAAPFASMRENLHAMLDGLGWRPLRSEWDYAETYRRITREVFADERRRAGLD